MSKKSNYRILPSHFVRFWIVSTFALSDVDYKKVARSDFAHHVYGVYVMYAYVPLNVIMWNCVFFDVDQLINKKI